MDFLNKFIVYNIYKRRNHNNLLLRNSNDKMTFKMRMCSNARFSMTNFVSARAPRFSPRFTPYGCERGAHTGPRQMNGLPHLNYLSGIDVRRVKTVTVRTTRHEKTGFTVVLSCLASGVKLKPMVNFKRDIAEAEIFF